MKSQVIGLLLSYLFLGAIIVVSVLAQKVAKVSNDTTRKIIHIGVGNWILFAFTLFQTPFYLVFVPATFVIINFLSYKFSLIKSMEQEESSLGTVWYAVSLLVLVLVGYYTGQKELAIAGILVMAYGDGLAAVIGRKFGKNKQFPCFLNKSVPGFIAMVVISFVVIWATLLFCTGQHYFWVSLFVAVCAGFIELSGSFGFDNLVVPLGTAFLLWIFLNFTFGWKELVIFGFTLLLLIVAARKGSLQVNSIAHAMLVALGLYFFANKNIVLYLALIIFFVLGSVLSKVGKKKNKVEGVIHKRTGARGTVQVYANAGVPLLFAFLYAVTQDQVFICGGVMAFAAAMADTAASEIGMLSKKEPLSIITFKKMPAGLSGGVSLLGLGASLIFSFLISLLLLAYGMHWVLVSTLAGFVGAILDSVLGATLQAKYISPSKTVTEKETLSGKSLPLYSGIKWIDNDFVNFISVLVSAFSVLWVAMLFVH